MPENIDCGIITSNINRRYFTGIKSSAGTLIVTRDCSYLLIDFRYIEAAKSLVKDCEVILLEDFDKQLSDIFEKHNIKSAGVENRNITLSKYKNLSEKHNRIKFLDSNELSDCIDSIRMVKTEYEIERITNAQRIAEKAYLNILNFIKPGISETDIATELYIQIMNRGAEDISFDIISVSGKNSSKPHGVPTGKLVEKGDFIILDFGAVVDGYHSDMTRTIAVDYVTDEMAEVYDTVLKGNLLGIQNIKYGAGCAAVDKSVRDYINTKGYEGKFGHGLGHGVGMEVHEFPNLSPKYNGNLIEGNVVTVEPGIYLEGKFGVRIEDMILVKKGGVVNLTGCGKELIILN